MSKIKVMDEILANKIAAGEVIERCVSIVKELVENSVDAGSKKIKVDLLDSGVREIKVTDDGIGMDESDALLAFSRHATSKLLSDNDLFNIHSLGFRGEALPSIASVSEVTLKTSQGNVGTLIVIKGGKIIKNENSDSRVGTEITVRKLFYNTPARLKHLSSLYTELAHITDFMNKIALSYPSISFVLTNDGKTLLNTNGSGNLLKVINNIYGIDITKRMLPIDNTDGEYIVNGYISLPEVNKSNRNNMITIVNGRVVRNLEINKCINDAYHTYKPEDRYPIVVLNIEVDTSLIDVNIHPTKMDIKFGNMEDLLSLVDTTIKERITRKTLIPHIEDKPKEINETTYEEIKLNFDEPIVSDIEEEYVVNSNLIDETEIHEDVVEKMPIMYPVGIVHGTYMICQNEIGMYIIDQHAAKERVNYEIVKDKLSRGNKESLEMMFPLTLEYTSSEFIILKENFDFLKNMGFDIEEFGVNSVIVKAYPLWLSNRFYENQAIKKLFELVIEKEKNFDIAKFNDHVAATMACKMSIKANTAITIEEAQNLIDDLSKCNNPFNCPHGRPTMIYYSKNDLEKLFKRSGF